MGGSLVTFLRSPRENSKNLPFTALETYSSVLVEVLSAVLTLSLLLRQRLVCPHKMSVLTLYYILWSCSCRSRLPLEFPPTQQLPKGRFTYCRAPGSCSQCLFQGQAEAWVLAIRHLPLSSATASKVAPGWGLYCCSLPGAPPCNG